MSPRVGVVHDSDSVVSVFAAVVVDTSCDVADSVYVVSSSATVARGSGAVVFAESPDVVSRRPVVAHRDPVVRGAPRVVLRRAGVVHDCSRMVWEFSPVVPRSDAVAARRASAVAISRDKGSGSCWLDLVTGRIAVVRSRTVADQVGVGSARVSPVPRRRMAEQLGFFAAKRGWPSGFEYEADILTLTEEALLIGAFAQLPFKEFDFHGFTGKRRVVTFGWRYDYDAARIREAEELPEVLLTLRERAAKFAGRTPNELRQALITEYRPGAPIGWHRDKREFGEVIGISLLSSCSFRLRRRVGDRWERVSLVLAPRSAYLMRGDVRHEWEHSIPPVEELRYSVTFRTLRDEGRAEKSDGRRG